MSKRNHPASRRQPHTPEHQDDAFVAGVMDASRWTSQNRQLLLLGSVVVALFVAGGVYYVNFQRSVRMQAINQLESIHQSISILALEDAKAQLSTFLDRFEGTDEAQEAVVLLGRLHLEAGDAAVAISVLERGGLSLGDGLGLQGSALLARAYEDQGRWPEAESLYLSIADRSMLDFQIRDALAGAARTRRRQQNTQGAAELYERILATFETDDPGRGIYEVRLAEMRGIAEEVG
jgi:predicted negative regulator of RcsB-dependent stress response